MFKASQAKNVEQYLKSVPAERKNMTEYLHQFIQKSAPDLKPHLAYNMLGYGKFKYQNYKGEEIDWPIVALANQKNYVSVYVCAVDVGEYIAEKHKDELGKVSVGKSCIRIKRLEDLNQDVLAKVIKQAAQKPGLAGASERKKSKNKK